MLQSSSTTPGITNQTITTTGPGSPAQQALARSTDQAIAQNNANLMGKGGSKYKGGAGNTIALAPMQSGTPASQVALNAKVQQSGAQSASNSQFDCAVNNSCPTTGGRKRSRTNKRKPRKSRRNHKKSKRRRSKSHRK